ncbi:MAG TPA: mandelate racemase/muconate lactonizing enzyme family protein, partial [Actinokineospora sp.]|nr:mandelate racemase/muconate lactonizing enzyme family protein [Actinokineospora sp.]
MRIVRVTATEVVVRANPGAIESPGLNKPLHKIPVRGTKSWTHQFDELPKVVIELELADGTVGLGELYRSHDWMTVDGIANVLLGQDIRELCRQDLPFAKVREHDGFEIAIWDAYAKLHGLRVVDLLGGPVRDRVAVGAWTGIRRDDEVGPLAKHYADLGFTCLKFKCSLDDDIVAWAAAVAGAAPGMQVIFDPNERFERPYETRRLAIRLAEIGNVLCLEDPIPHWMRDEYAELRRTSPVPIVRHIALPYPVLGNRIQD